jgi:hypothetical protein
MPITRAVVSRLRVAWASSGILARSGLVVAAAMVAPFYLVLGPLWFDFAYGGLRFVAPGRLSRRARTALSIGAAALIVGALLVSSSPGPATGSGPSGSPLAAASATGSVAPSPARSETGSAVNATDAPAATQPVSPSASAIDTSSGDNDDDPGASAPPPASAPPVKPGATLPPSGVLPGEPNPALTPGSLNPAVTQATIHSTICVSGWTATIRPPSSYTTELKIEQMAQYGYSDRSTADYEEDHLISLELGGNPTDAKNLWPEPYTAFLPDGRPTGARTKDVFETELKNKVCAGTITLADGQREIGDRWVHYYYGITVTSGPVPTAGPTSAPTATPPSATLPPGATLAVSIASLPDSVAPGANATMTVQTLPGASCTAKVTYHSGTVSSASGLAGARVTPSNGTLSWTWKVGATTGAGTSTAVVTCTLGGQTDSDSRTFAVS